MLIISSYDLGLKYCFEKVLAEVFADIFWGGIASWMGVGYQNFLKIFSFKMSFNHQAMNSKLLSWNFFWQMSANILIFQWDPYKTTQWLETKRGLNYIIEFTIQVNCCRIRTEVKTSAAKTTLHWEKLLLIVVSKVMLYKASIAHFHKAFTQL